MTSAYTVTEAARLLKLHPKTVRRKIREGELGSTRIGRQYRITSEQLDAFCAGLSIEPEVAPVNTRRQVLVSSVVDVDAIAPEDSSRISNSMMAALNGAPNGARVDCIYYEEVGRLKVVIYGDLASSREILAMLEHLLLPVT